MAIDWWTNADARKKLDSQLEKKIQDQIASIELAYKNARIPGRAPKHWISKVSKLRAMNCKLPKGLEHLANQSASPFFNDLLRSLNSASKKYYKVQYSSIRSKVFRSTQKKYINDHPDNQSQIVGGRKSGQSRKLKRDAEAKEILKAYLNATAYTSKRLPLARTVAKWFVEYHLCPRSTRAVTQLLKRAGVAI